LEEPAPEAPDSPAMDAAEAALPVDELESVKARNVELESILADIRAKENRKAVSDAFHGAADERGIALNEKAMEVFNWDAFTDGESVNSAAISAVLDLFQTSPKFSQNLGLGPQGSNRYGEPSPVSLDARDRQ
jgi:hypothetical protein